MKNVLNELSSIIDLLISLFPSGEINQLDKYCQKAQLEAIKIKPILIQQFYSIENETIQKLFIRNHFARLILLNDDLFNAVEKRSKENQERYHDLVNKTMPIQLVLDELLLFIWDNFTLYCDSRQRMSKKSQITFTWEVARKLETLKIPENDPDHNLNEKIKASVLLRLNIDQSRITYGLKLYLEEFIQAIETIRASNKEHSLAVTIKNVIIAFNFNSLPVIHYFASFFVDQLRPIESAKDKIDFLNQWLKNVNQVPIKPGYSFNPKHEAVNFFLSNCILEEIHFYEKALFLFSGFDYPVRMQGIANTGYKIETELSVGQIACLVRLFVDCQVVKTKNIRELLNFLSVYTQSKKRENISAESLRLKYYNIEEGTREEVHKILFRLLKRSSQPF